MGAVQTDLRGIPAVSPRNWAADTAFFCIYPNVSFADAMVIFIFIFDQLLAYNEIVLGDSMILSSAGLYFFMS